MGESDNEITAIKNAPSAMVGPTGYSLKES